LKVRKGEILIIIFCYLVLMGIAFLNPVIIKYIMDQGMMEKNFQLIFQFALVLLILVSVEEGISILQEYFFQNLHNSVALNLHKKVFYKLLRMRMKYFQQHNATEIMNRLASDIESVSLVVDSNMMNIFRYVFQIISGVVGLVVIEWKLAIMVLLMIPIKCFLICIFARKKERAIQEWITAEADFSAWFADNVQGLKEIKLWNLYRGKCCEFKKRKKEVLIIRKKSALLEAFNFSSDSMLQGIMTMMLYIAGGFLVCQKNFTIGGITAFISYSSYVIGPIALLFNLRFTFAQIRPSLERLREFLKEEVEEEAKNGCSIERFEKDIRFESVKFGYAEQLVLRKINLNIKKGEKIALIGKNGCGKSTIVNLLLRFLEPQEGHIYIDGMDIKQCKLEAYRNLFAVISQDIYLFCDSVWNNIVMGKEIDASRLENISEKLQLHTLIKSFPKGYDTVLQGNGENLSGGERQKIALLRAVIKDAPILIMDEATAHIDGGYSNFLQEYILQEFSDKTIIMITHNKEHLTMMDRIYEVKEGMIR